MMKRAVNSKHTLKIPEGAVMESNVFCSSAEGDPSDIEKMADFMGPGHVDQTIRQAVQFCWMNIPKDRRTVEELEKQVRRLVDRALRDFREDRKEFGR
jgi:hypothetical protein